ncbi:MAG: hypothetical protein V4591_02925, partial [Bdellovibrionota bacterium]
YFQALLPENFKSSQGLFWESSKTNYLLSSYNAILFKEHGGVIDYVWQTPTNCAVEACFVDHFLRDFNIGTFVVDPALQWNTLPFFQKECLQQIIDNQKTSKNILIKKGTMDLNYLQISKKLSMNVYEVKRSSPTVYDNNSPIEIIYPDTKIVKYDSEKSFYYSDYFSYVENYCENKIENKLFIPLSSSIESLNFSQNSAQNVSLKFEKIEKNKFRIFVDSNEPLWFKIKLSWVPGFKLTSYQGENLELYPGMGFMIGHGRGEINLEYKKPMVFYLAYAVSTISFVMFILLCVFERNQSRRNRNL